MRPAAMMTNPGQARAGEAGAALPGRDRASEVLARYAAADENLRLALWLDHRDLREAFDRLEGLGPPAPKPRGFLAWLRRRR